MKFKKLSHVLIFCLGIMLMFFAIGEIFNFLENKFFSYLETANPYIFMAINRIIKTFIGIFILKKLGKIDILKNKGKGFGYGVLLGAIMLIPNIYQTLLSIWYVLANEPELQPLGVIITMVCMFLTVGLYEELMFRGIILGVIDDYFGHKSAGAVWKTVILSGIFFGIFHLEGLTGNGVSFLYVLNLAIANVGAGIFWGAVYMRSRNLYSLMFLHAVDDIFAAAVWLSIAGNSLQKAFSSSQVDFRWTFAMMIVEILLAMFLLRKKKMAEIINPQPNKLSLKPEYN